MSLDDFLNTHHHEDQVITQLDLQNLTLDGYSFDNCVFEYCKFNQAIFQNCRFTDCEFTHSNLSLAKFPSTSFLDVRFTEDCKAIGVDWSELNPPSRFSFAHSNLDDTYFYKMKLDKISIQNCSIRNAAFVQCSLIGANFKGSSFQDTSFSECNLMQANFRDAEDYFIDLFSNKLTGAKFSSPEALNLLAALNIEVF